MNITKIKVLFLAIFTLFLTTSCEDDSPTISDPLPEFATISGTITFDGTWPTTGVIALSLSSSWPPTGAPAASMEITSSDLINDMYNYIFDNVSFGDYGAIAVSWQDPEDDNPGTNQHIIGSYGGTAEYIYGAYYDADSITVSVDNYELSNLDFTADLSLAVGVGD